MTSDAVLPAGDAHGGSSGGSSGPAGGRPPGAPVEVFDDTFDEVVLGSPVPVLVDFWAEWCQPCRVVAPVLAEIAADYAGRLTVATLDTEVNPETTAAYGVVSIPTLVFVAGGEVVRVLVGARPKPDLVAEVEQVLAEV